MHHDNPLLCKFLCKQSMGSEHVESTSSSSCFATVAVAETAKFNATATQTLASASSQKVVVKIGNMAWHNFK